MERTLIPEFLAERRDHLIVLLILLRLVAFPIRGVFIRNFLIFSRVDLYGLHFFLASLHFYLGWPGGILHLDHLLLDFPSLAILILVLQSKVDGKQHEHYKQDDVLVELRNDFHGDDPESCSEADTRNQYQDNMIVHE